MKPIANVVMDDGIDATETGRFHWRRLRKLDLLNEGSQLLRGGRVFQEGLAVEPLLVSASETRKLNVNGFIYT